MVEEENPESKVKDMEEDELKYGLRDYMEEPLHWVKMLAKEMHWSFVFGVVIVDGVSQGLGGALNCVGTEYYMKHVQKVQPSEAQIYQEFTFIPWMVKPIYGLMTDVIPILGYHRRPYFIFAATDRMLVNCDEKLKSIFLGKSKVDLAELPALIKLHFPKQPK